MRYDAFLSYCTCVDLRPPAIDEVGQSSPIKAAPTTAKAQYRKIRSKRNATAMLSCSSLWRPVATAPLSMQIVMPSRLGELYLQRNAKPLKSLRQILEGRS